MGIVTLTKGSQGKIAATFPYRPDFVARVKSISGHRWHPDDKCWSFPHTYGIMEKILKAFEGEDIRIEPALKSSVPNEQSIAPMTTGEANASQFRPHVETQLCHAFVGRRH